ncbi:hypothetical protein [Paenibacillus eucommiae]|uniref:ABC-type glycerol-3-phosphate transport system permease component n=1 Tax=Paenibacillus eucommiae TaxID=1355755 RepID=A0ABS4IMP5_9BACL|nr:hypothetical protein [Paenibacillus eucommiae]MBP1988839.1 ABC-type glycerol-3-phosphate transport system permease component [Paenibacillus eucommiae]
MNGKVVTGPNPNAPNDTEVTVVPRYIFQRIGDFGQRCEGDLTRDGRIVADWFPVRAYNQLISNYTFMRSMLNTVFLKVTNTSLVILFSLSSAYALSSENLIDRKPIFYYFIITMFFSGGLVPTYLLVNNSER